MTTSASTFQTIRLQTDEGGRVSIESSRMTLACCDKTNNAIGNLEVMPMLEHLQLHKAWENGGDWNRAKTHCPRGHPYAGDNLHIPPNGERHCRACARENARRYRAEKKAGQ